MTPDQLIRRGDYGLAAAIPVCGLLDATAVFNTASFGIAIFYPLTGLLAVRLWRQRIDAARLWRQDDGLRLFLSMLILFLGLLWGAMAIQGLLLARDTQMHFMQGVARSMPVIFCGLAALFLAVTRLEVVAGRALLAFGTIYLLYGLYDFAAQALHLPRFLEFLRNSNSTYIARHSGGWIDLPRVTSLSAEPSSTSMPAAAIIAAIWIGLRRGWRRRLMIAVAVLFVVGTFSRTLWLVFVGAAAAVGLAAVMLRLHRRHFAPLLQVGLLVLAIAGPAAMLYARSGITGEGQDFSIVERQDSTRAAVTMFLQDPLTGQGLGGLRAAFRSYANSLLSVSKVPAAIHNALAAYLGTLGILGLAIYSIPLLLIVQAGEAAPLAATWALLVFVLIGQSYDNYYFVSSWTALLLLFLLSQARRCEGVVGPAWPALAARP